jgi:hypothetical protein
MPKLQEKPSALKREHPVLKNMKILDFFLFLWVIFALLDPDPIQQLKLMRIHADPDPKPCQRVFYIYFFGGLECAGYSF